MRKINKRKAQSTLEYAVLIIIIAAALLATQVYIKRAVQGRLRSASDDIGGQFSASGNTTVSENSYSQTKEVQLGSSQTSTLTAAAQSNRSESANLGNADMEYWGKQ